MKSYLQRCHCVQAAMPTFVFFNAVSVTMPTYKIQHTTSTSRYVTITTALNKTRGRWIRRAYDLKKEKFAEEKKCFTNQILKVIISFLHRHFLCISLELQYTLLLFPASC